MAVMSIMAPPIMAAVMPIVVDLVVAVMPSMMLIPVIVMMLGVHGRREGQGRHNGRKH